MTKNSFYILLFLFITSSKSFSQNNQHINDVDFKNAQKVLKREIKKIIDETGIPSISLTLIKGDSIYWSAAFGYTNVKKKIPATINTIYSTGSNFKFVTATAIMQLAESNKLNIDLPINNYLGKDKIKDLSNKGTPVTIRHLLSHHSGLNGKIEIIPLWERKLPKTLKELASTIESDESPGINFKYCNHCYGLLGLIIEKVSGISFENYIIENILKPLQIKSENPITPTPKMIEELALPYKLDNNQPVPEKQSRFDVYPAGDIYLTTKEMSNFYIAQLNNGVYKGNSILNSESISEMQKPQFKSSYGFGIGTNGKYLSHSGGVPGFSTFFKAKTKAKVGVYIAANAGNTQTSLRIIGDLALRLMNGNKNIKNLPSLAKKDFTEINLEKEILTKYIGKYQLSKKFIINITLENKKIYAQATGQPKIRLFPYNKNNFFIKVIYAQIKFKIQKNKTIGLTLFQGGKEKYGNKIE